jgi:hypothetical protein
MRDATHAFCLRPKVVVPEETTHKHGDVLFGNRQANKAVSAVAEGTSIESKVAGEKRGPSMLVQKRDNLVVLKPLFGEIVPNLSDRNAPTP